MLSPISLPTPLRSVTGFANRDSFQLTGRYNRVSFTQRLVVGDFFFCFPVSDYCFFFSVNLLNHYYKGLTPAAVTSTTGLPTYFNLPSWHSAPNHLVGSVIVLIANTT